MDLGMAMGGGACGYSCRLLRDPSCRHPVMPVAGHGRKKVLIVAPVPNEDDDARGMLLCGRGGTMLRKLLMTMDISPKDDCWWMAAVRCHPPKGRDPTREESLTCRSLMDRDIKALSPRLVVLLDRPSLASFLNDRIRDMGELARWRGQVWPDRHSSCWTSCLQHPDDVEDDPMRRMIFKKDLKRAISQLDVPFPTLTAEEPKVSISTTTKEILAWMKMANRSRLLAFDYETTGRKPQAEGHRIVCASFSTDGESAYAFPISDREVNKEWVRMLWNKEIKKIAHNMKFEETWSRVRLGVKVRGWLWDSMLAAHVLDNRRHSTDLKFQSLINFGVYDYSSAVEPYLTRPLNREQESKGANAINKVEACPLDKLLTYCGMDSMLEFRLAQVQMKKMGWKT